MSFFPSLFSLRKTLSSFNATGEDVVKIKRALSRLGHYKVPDFGITPYADTPMFDGIKAFQESSRLAADGLMKPGGPTERGLNAALAETDAGKRQGSYIWRTTGDNKVRSSHAERDGKVFSWDLPPEGGHPGEDYNCRCRAEERDCTNEKFRRGEINDKQSEVGFIISQLKMLINNKKLEIKISEAKTKDWEDRGLIGVVGGALSRFPNPYTKGVGIIAELVGAPSALEIMSTMEQLKKDKAELREFEEELRPLEDEWKNLDAELKYAEEKLKQCQAGGKENAGRN